MKDYQQAFLDFAMQQGVLRFGEFTLKSGRKSPCHAPDTCVYCRRMGRGGFGANVKTEAPALLPGIPAIGG